MPIKRPDLFAQADEQHLLASAPVEGLEACPIELLVYLKLKSPRPRDMFDVLELIRSGIELEVCRAYLKANAPELLPSLEKAEQDAWRGEE